MSNTTPAGMIHVNDFAKEKGMDPKKVIDMVRDGFYVGRIHNDEWYVSTEENTLTGSTHTSENSNLKSNYGFSRGIAGFLTALGVIGLIAGIAMCLASGKSQQFYLADGISVLISSIVLFAVSQIIKISADSADQSAEILELLKTSKG